MTDKLIGCVQHDCDKCKARDAELDRMRSSMRNTIFTDNTQTVVNARQEIQRYKVTTETLSAWGSNMEKRIAELESFREVDADTMNAMQAEIEQRDALIAELEAEVERLTVQLAGCGVAAMGNTESSKSERAKRGDYGYSESYAAVCQAVDREIALRAEVERLKAQEPVGWVMHVLECSTLFLEKPDSNAIPLFLASGAAQKETDRDQA